MLRVEAKQSELNHVTIYYLPLGVFRGIEKKYRAIMFETANDNFQFQNIFKSTIAFR